MRQKFNKCHAMLAVLPGLLACPALAKSKTDTSMMAMPNSTAKGDLPRSKFTIQSALRVDLTHDFATLPLYKGMVNGTPVWYVITDVSDANLARTMGVNFAPNLVNLLSCPGCVQQVESPTIPLGRTGVTFQGMPDFKPMRQLIPGPMGFPPMGAAPGGMGDIHYSPFIRVGNTNVVFNAPIVATGDGPFDVKEHTNTHDRVLGIDTNKMTVDLLFVRGFADGQSILYLSFEASDAGSAVIERATFTGGLSVSPFPDGGKDPSKSARTAIFSFANGQTNKMSPPAQGLNHVIIDGHNAEDANLENTDLLESLRLGGDARNIFDNFPTLQDPKLRNEYTPLWDLHLAEWSPEAVAKGLNVAQMDANVIRQLAAKKMITAPGGLPLGSANIVINCPALAFTDAMPVAPQAPKPKDIP